MMELLTGLIVISVVSSVVLPGILNFQAAQRVKADASTFVANVRLARYSAIQEQRVMRIIFSAEVDAYKVEEHIPGESFTEKGVYDSNYWRSIVGINEVLLSPGMELDNDDLEVVFFKPDGFIYYRGPSGPELLDERNFRFEYSSAAINVAINSLGVISSQSYSSALDFGLDDDEIW